MKKSLYSVIFATLLASASVATAQIQMTFSIVQPSCHGFTDGSVTVLAVGGTGAYTYVWNNGQTTQTNFGIGAGLYSVTVTDAALSTASGSIAVSEPSAVSVAITATNLTCDGASGTLTASGFGGTPPYTYAWNGPGGPSSSQSVSVVAPGNYFVTATDANNCKGVGSFTVATPITVDAVATDIPCSYYPTGGSLNAIVTGGVTPYTFSWSNGASTQIINGVGAGPYIVVVTGANGCTASDSDNVDIPQPLEVEVIWLTPACGGNNNGSAIIKATGGTPPYTHTWTPGPLSGASQSGLAPGTYYVCTFDANGCQKDITVVIPATNGLDVQLVVSSAACIGINNASVTAVVSPPVSGYIYEWNIPTNSNSTQLTGLAAGTVVSVTVTDPASGCTGTATAVVGGHTNIEIAVTDVDILCAGGFGSATAVASNGTPPYSYTWFTNGVQISDSSSIFGLNAGAYLVSVVDSLGCMAQAVADIGILSAPHAVIDGDSVLVCGDSLSTVQFTNLSTDTYNTITTLVWTLTGPSIDTVIFQQNQVVIQLPVNETILVQLIATSGLGCADTATLQYNVPGYPDITLSLDSTTLNCTASPVGINVINGDTSYTYVWSPGVTFNPDPLHVLVSPTVLTTFVLTATDGNACTATDSIMIAPIDSLFQLFVSDSLIRTCSDSVTLFASTTIPATITWVLEGDIAFSGNSITVPATAITSIYAVLAVTADSCILRDTISVTGFGVEISLDSNVVLSICEGDSLTLSVNATPPSASLQYLWSVNAPGILINPTSANPKLTGPAGIYTVTVIVTNVICSDTLSFQVEILPGFNFEGQILADLCDGLAVSFFNQSAIGGVWEFGDGSISNAINPVHTYTTGGPYNVVFTPGLQCAAPWDSMIQVQSVSLMGNITVIYLDCVDEAEIQFSGSSNYPDSVMVSWGWTFSSGIPATSSAQNPTVIFTEEDTMTAILIVRDINGCLDTVKTQVYVYIVQDTIPNALTICPGESIQINPAGFDFGAVYKWTSVPFDSSLDVSDPTPLVTPTVPTNYSVEIRQGAFCSVLYTVAVDFKPGSTVELPSDTIVCTSDLLSITALTNGSVEWSTTDSFTNIFAATKTVQLLPNGMYYVRTTSLAECADMDSIRIDLEIPEIQIMPGDTMICLGEETALMLVNLNPDYVLVTYTWNPALPNVPNPIVSPTENTTYSVTVTNQYGCTASIVFPTVNVTNVSVNAEIIGEDTLLTDQTTTLLATPGGNGNVISFEWTPAGTLSSPNVPQTVASPKEPTTYVVTVTTDDGCVAIDSVRVHYRQNACISPFVFIPKAFTPNHDDKNDFFIVRADGMTELKMIIWNRWGEIVYETYDPNDQGWDGTYKGKEATADSFAWYVLLTCGNGDVYEDKGNVTILK